MKFSIALIALAGVSSANAALRGVLPSNMKELVHDKFAAVQDECTAYAHGHNKCETTMTAADCYGDSGLTAEDCPMACNYEHARNGNAEGYYCRPNGGQDVFDKFAAVQDECTAYAHGHNKCETTMTAADCYGDSGLKAEDCPMACNYEHARNGNAEGYYCRPNGGQDVFDKFAAVQDECTAYAHGHNKCETTMTAADCYGDSGLTAEDCPMACNYEHARNGNAEGYYCRPNGGQDESDA